nr:ribonuclease H-like domain-containing protein [Tanacetum cinerariifolium]
NAKNPQQNRVAERKNITLIEAARSMLVDSKLPTIFWTESVSTACYVLNRVSITNPHNKTPYELLSGKVPNIRNLKPFGCQVTILNTSDHLGKFEGKANDGFLVGYAANSKAYTVYNLSSKKVEETLNLRYLEDKPNAQGLGQEWYFDLDYLTDSFGYAHFKTNTHAGTQDTNINASTQDVDSDSKCDQQAILVPSFPSNSFLGPKIMKSSTTNFETSNVEVPSNKEEVFHESSKSFQEESSSSSLNDDAQQSPEEVILPQINTQSISNNMVPNVDEAGTSHNMFNKCLEDAYFDAIPRPKGKIIIKTKWIFKNKKDESSLVIQNKVRLIAVGYSQQEGIDYDETFAPVA